MDSCLLRGLTHCDSSHLPFLTLAEGKEQFSMLGLGDIVIPGIFVAIVLRYDIAHGRQTRFFRR